MKLVGVSGSLIGSKTSKSVFEVLNAAKKINPAIETELVDLKDYDVEFVRGIPLPSYNGDTVTVVNKILTADLLVFGTPIYQASISGALKNLLDHIPTDSFKSKVTAIVSTGGSDKHFLVAEYHLKPILSFLKGVVPNGSVFVQNAAFNEDNEISDPDVLSRIKLLSEEMLVMQKSISSR
ncbi:NADPH-dependent FMN reductase [Mesobacillus selenatarsenatis]|uniref:NAD(P)H-dependent oxidoreductase n=1 Tax=Mesobacillus selenatarsenatis TaxID=388741 RepID=A0A846TC77_9BACI|nr:NAD(P)H-dependent oxidoreductase [Mesobacillus selenatarsenatis]NKE06668.1 NAD(P)H-dependent oxidoreductase [Mesobacillus selenatarsenatis]